MKFILLGLPATAALAALVSARGVAFKIGVTSAVAAVLAAVWVITEEPIMLGSGAWFERSPFWEAVLFVVMILGMMTRTVTAAIEESKRLRKPGSRRSLKPAFDKWEFALPLFFSVMTFGSVLSALHGDGVTIANIVVSFQTGFVWQTLLAARAPSGEPTPNDPVVREK